MRIVLILLLLCSPALAHDASHPELKDSEVQIRGIMHLTYRNPPAHTGVVSAASAETGAPQDQSKEVFHWAEPSTGAESAVEALAERLCVIQWHLDPTTGDAPIWSEMPDHLREFFRDSVEALLDSKTLIRAVIIR